MQAVYAFFQSGDDNLPAAEKELVKSIRNLSELFTWQLSFLLEIHDHAQNKVEDGKAKFLPTAEDLNPNLRFIQNPILCLLSGNLELRRMIGEYKISWITEPEIIRKIYRKIKSDEDYIQYMDNPESSVGNDRSIIIKLFKKYLAKSKDLATLYGEKNIFWQDDLPVVNQMITRCLSIIPEDAKPNESLLALSSEDTGEDEKEDMLFARQLFTKSVIHREDYGKIISSKAKNWESERLAVTDVVLLTMAITELIQFPEIPIKVTMNEYIELSKIYSTPKSKVFINGILDNLVIQLKEEKKIRKTGRGLIDR